MFRIGTLVLFLLLAACGDPVTRANGTVRDQNGNPLESVTIIMESNAQGTLRKEAEQKTKPDGTFSFTEITGSATLVRLKLTKDGFKTIEKDITPNQENKGDFVLERDVK